MRILLTIPHYFASNAAPRYASERGMMEARLQMIRLNLASLKQTFSEAQGLLDGRRRYTHPANSRFSNTITIMICTTGNDHLASYLTNYGITHISSNAEPRFLGFECHKVLYQNMGHYDYYAYLEDDLRITDGLFFTKLAWFNAKFGDDAILQPNRFEVSTESSCKLYVDGNLRDAATSSALRRMDGQQRLKASVFNSTIVFERVENPHSGCFFLSAAQLAHWAAQPDFGVPSDRFCGPLESAATLGIMEHFRVYKPARENAAFFELEHLDRRYPGRFYFLKKADGELLIGPWP